MQKKLLRIVISVLTSLALMMALPTSHTIAAEPRDTWIPNEYLIYIKEISNQYHICPEMVMAIIEHESSGQADAVNGGCKGLMQIYEKYHTDRMKRLDVADIYDPYRNILVGCDYLAELFNEYEDMSVVLMKYNGTSDALTRTYEERTEYAESIMKRTMELERLHEEKESSEPTKAE
mgnify:CR=1 FL=1|nr:MAG TPA: hypothetical protein [Caudoviricetes sp.]